MQIQRNNVGFTIIITEFDKQNDLITKFRHTDILKSPYNRPVDFAEVGLLGRNKYDKWLPDIILSLSTDEAAPCVVKDDYIGANHGTPCAVKIYSPGHKRDFSDIGTVWCDSDGTRFTIIRIDDEDYITLVSENLGKDECDYSFKRSVCGNLTKNNSEISFCSQRCVYLANALRLKERCVFGIVDGKKVNVDAQCICNRAEITDNYDIINPATVAPELARLRPVGGYKENPDLSMFGEVMIEHNMTYVVLEDGTVLSDFDLKRKMNVRFERWIGIMFQARRDTFGGGIYRYLPKTKLFEADGKIFDFSAPLSLAESYPQNHFLEKEGWLDEFSPPDRCIDYYRNNEGEDVICFASGFLPVFDGEPSIRCEKITHAGHLYKTRKYYATFANGDIKETRGIGYKKYFIPQCDGASVYNVEYGDKIFIFADFFKENEIKVAVSGDLKLVESYGDLEYSVEDGILHIKGKKGCMTLIESVCT